MESPSRSRTERFLVVRVAGQEYAVPVGRIAGMMQMRGLDVTEVEGAGALRWTARLHGRSIPVLSPHRSLGHQERPVSARSCVLLVRSDDEPERPRCGLMVDSVSRLEEVSPAQLRSGGQIRLGEKWRSVLDIDTLCAA